MSSYLGDKLISGAEQFVGESRNIGQIIPSAIPLTDAGLHLLDGALIQGSGIYSAFVTYIAGIVSTYPNLFVTESAWQSAVTTYGVCGKFVYDSTNNTVRLPKVTGKLDGTTDVNTLGDLKPLLVKLPNITGIKPDWIGDAGYVGAMYATTTTSHVTANSPLENPSTDATGFDASRSSSVYSGNGSDTTIHEQAVNVLLYIVIATSTKTDIEVDIDALATDVNGKADRDLLNVSDTGNIQMAKASMPSSRYIDLTLGANGTIYTAPVNGYVYIAGNVTYGSVHLTRIDGLGICCGPRGDNYINFYLPVLAGMTYTIYYGGFSANQIFRFYYAEGEE